MREHIVVLLLLLLLWYITPRLPPRNPEKFA